MKRILVADDDPHLREVVVYALEREGWTVRAVADGRAALDVLTVSGTEIDLLVLDILMPELDGIELCRRVRASDSPLRKLPIVFLSSRDEEIDRVLGLELGGDDYVTKPFSPRELVARVRAVLRRTEPPASVVAHGPASVPPGHPSRTLRHGPIEVDAERHTVTCHGHAIALTVTEFGLLASLMERPGVVLSRAQLMERAYAYDNLVTERTIDTHVKRVRRKFRDAGFDPIDTVHGVGYRVRS